MITEEQIKNGMSFGEEQQIYWNEKEKPIELLKEFMFYKFLTKMIFKRVYNLNDSQYNRAIKQFEEDSEEAAKKYLERIGR